MARIVLLDNKGVTLIEMMVALVILLIVSCVDADAIAGNVNECAKRLQG
jgi:prepilin-type N-terminal cleavage/methylation domain-containing protein